MPAFTFLDGIFTTWRVPGCRVRKRRLGIRSPAETEVRRRCESYLARHNLLSGNDGFQFRLR